MNPYILFITIICGLYFISGPAYSVDRDTRQVIKLKAPENEKKELKVIRPRKVAGKEAQARSDEEVISAVNSHYPDLKKIWQSHGKFQPGVGNQVSFKLKVSPDGGVTVIRLTYSNLKSPMLESKLMKRLQEIRLSAEDAGVWVGLYELNFTP